ncbi:hypothetical protein ABKA17_36015 [Streptomyces sp. RG80]
MADDRDGLAGVGADDLLEGRCSAGNDVVSRFAVRDTSAQIPLDNPGAQHFGCLFPDGGVG